MIRLFRLWRLTGRDLRLLWFALNHPSRPIWLMPAALLMGLYAIEPMNLAVPVLGVVDDFVVLPIVLHLVLKLLPMRIRMGFD